ncbi:hypothetical protein FACS1894184_17670 [Clostridia bacterium]|nr:hypothetical protein FACS1894184_17670 [Clostridia bacterium]
MARDRKKSQMNKRLGKMELDRRNEYGYADPTAQAAIHTFVKKKIGGKTAHSGTA